MKHYKRGETPKLYTTCRAETHNSDGTLSDGSLANATTSMKVIIEDESGEVVQALADATASATGLYYYAGYTIATNATTGKYHYSFRAIDGSAKVVDQDGYFIVEAEIA